MADELKDHRVVTMMSPSELEAIDDWMFRSRIRSRGEAIRRLCQMGIVLDAGADDTHAKLFKGSEALRKSWLKLGEERDKKKPKIELDELIGEMMDAQEFINDAMISLLEMIRPAAEWRYNERLESAMEAAKEEIREVREMRERFSDALPGSNRRKDLGY